MKKSHLPTRRELRVKNANLSAENQILKIKRLTIFEAFGQWLIWKTK